MRGKLLKIFIFQIFFLILPLLILGQEKLSLTITPPLIKVNFNPGQTWQSAIKIVNNNPQDLNIFVKVMDFKSGPEGGIVFIKEKTEGEKKYLLSEWIEFPKEPILIPAFQSKEIPFTIKVPENAEPGGKYAAILAGPQAPEKTEGTVIKITPLVSSLVLATVRGETREAIWIREFSTDKIFYQKPKVNFTLKIENIGNVHIQPKGEIKIFNMLGKERGKISFNQNTEYGNILPQSARKWNFSWEGEDLLFEAGRYKAILNLTYGNELTQTETKEIHFWILPLVPLATILGIIFLFFLLVFLTIRIYVKRTVAGILLEAKTKISFIPQIGKKKISDISVVKKVEEEKPIIKKKVPIILERKIFIPLILTLILIAFLILSFLVNELKESKKYHTEIKAEKEQISPENVTARVKEMEVKEISKGEEINRTSFSISILNGTKIQGLAKKTGEKLTKEGFKIAKIDNADNFNYQQTLIRYKKGKEKEAQFLNNFFGGKFKLLEAENQKEEVILIIGRDFEF